MARLMFGRVLKSHIDALRERLEVVIDRLEEQSDSMDEDEAMEEAEDLLDIVGPAQLPAVTVN